MPSIEFLTENVKTPMLRVRCARPCPHYAQAEVDLAKYDMNQSVQAFMQIAGESGWIIGLLGNLCPDHARQAKAPSIVVPPSGVRIN